MYVLRATINAEIAASDRKTAKVH